VAAALAGVLATALPDGAGNPLPGAAGWLALGIGVGLGCLASYWPVTKAQAKVTSRTPTTAEPNRMIRSIRRAPSC